MKKPTNSLAAAAIALGVDAEDLQSILPTLQEAKHLRRTNPAYVFTVNATCLSLTKDQAEAGLLSTTNIAGLGLSRLPQP